MPAALLPSSTDDYAEFTGEQLALETSERVRAIVRGSKIIGGRVRNGAQCFLSECSDEQSACFSADPWLADVPYALPVPRWTDAQPLPADWSYEEREYVADGLYCAQPQREYSTVPIRDRCGLGEPTDTPFFADIYIPSHVDLSRAESYDLPVKVFVHGGFLQFGSTSGNNYNQQAYAAEVRNEVRVLLGHRVSVLGFLAASSPNVDGNYGFKDALLGLEWVRDHVKSFGGDPQNVHLSGLSGGGHVVAQLLHQAARRAPLPAPYRTATLYSNAILCDAAELDSCQSQFDALCLQLGLDPRATDVLDALRAMPTKQLIAAVERLGKHSTFRGTQGRDGWMQELVKFQSSPAFSRGLRAAGVESVFVGEVSEERAFYQQVHPAASTDELVPNLMRYYPEQEARRLAATYPPLSKASSGAEIDAHFGQVRPVIIQRISRTDAQCRFLLMGRCTSRSASLRRTC